MKGILLAAACAAFAGCGAGDNRVDPADLEMRDLLGMSPDIAQRWDAKERAAAREVIADGLRDGDPVRVTLADGASLDQRLERSLANLDVARAKAGRDALGTIVVAVDRTEVVATAHRASLQPAKVEALDVELAGTWPIDPARGRDVIEGFATELGATGKLVVKSAPRLAAVAGYVAAHDREPAHLLVNPIVLAALEPIAGSIDPVTPPATPTETSPESREVRVDDPTKQVVHTAPEVAASTGGNPYSFYGSVAECAAAQRDRCEACLPNDSCKPVTTATGTDECTRLGENGGQGYYLICINLSLAIDGVATCALDKESSCTQATEDTASNLDKLAANQNYFDNATCAMALDACLAQIYGAPKGSFPGPDGGVSDDPPRNTEVKCGDSCSNDNCSFDPTCNGPSCGNSFSCDSTCSSSTDQSGCGGNCDGCKSSGGGGGNGGGGCSDGGSSGSSCSGDGSSGSCGGGSSSNSGCGGSDCSNSDSGGCGGGGGSCSGGGGGGGGCTVAEREPSAAVALVVSVAWGFLPVPLAGLVRRRAKRSKSARDAKGAK